jgi:hypothetical protein
MTGAMHGCTLGPPFAVTKPRHTKPAYIEGAMGVRAVPY